MAAVYRTLITQQKTHTVQEQVSDMQQNVRAAMGQMTKEIRMAGYGGDILASFDNVNGFTNIITPASNSATILLADQVGVLGQNAATGTNQLSMTNASTIFNTGNKKYLCLNGLNHYSIQSVLENTITLTANLAEDHIVDEPVYLVKAITYNLGLSDGKNVIQRDENTGDGPQPLAENIESLQFTYFDANGNVTATEADIRMIKVTVTAKSNISDSEYKGGDGYRRRTLTSDINVRNMGL
jgi:hypothetical protein